MRSPNPILPPPQHFFEGLLKGGSASWWRNRHNKHHAKTNVLGEDGDLRTTPFFAWDMTLAQKVPDWSLKTQAFTFLPALGAYVFVFAYTVFVWVMGGCLEGTRLCATPRPTPQALLFFPLLPFSHPTHTRFRYASLRS